MDADPDCQPLVPARDESETATPFEGAFAKLRDLDTADDSATYDCAIEQCRQRSAVHLTEVTLELVGSLDFDCRPVAEGSAACEKAREEDFEKAAWILQNLRETWLESRAATERAGASGGPLSVAWVLVRPPGTPGPGLRRPFAHMLAAVLQ
jgi:hypothetical protein